MNRRNSGSTLGLLGLLAALEGMRPGQRPDPMEELISGMGGMGSGGPSLDEIEELYIAAKPFQPIPEEGRGVVKDLIESLSKLNLDDIDSLFFTVVLKSPAGEKCEGCGEVHNTDGVHQMVGLAGDPVTVRAAVGVALREGMTRAARNAAEREEAEEIQRDHHGRPVRESAN